MTSQKRYDANFGRGRALTTISEMAWPTGPATDVHHHRRSEPSIEQSLTIRPSTVASPIGEPAGGERQRHPPPPTPTETGRVTPPCSRTRHWLLRAPLAAAAASYDVDRQHVVNDTDLQFPAVRAPLGGSERARASCGMFRRTTTSASAEGRTAAILSSAVSDRPLVQ